MITYKKISELAAAGALDLTELVELEQAGAGAKATLQVVHNKMLAALIAAKYLSVNLQIDASGQIVTPDADSFHLLGRTFMGYDGTNSDYAVFGHRDHRSITNGAFVQRSTGAVHVNSVLGQAINLRTNNATKFYISGTTGDLLPSAAASQNIGAAAVYVNEVNAKDFLDRAALSVFDPEKSYNLIRDLTNEAEGGHCKKIEDLGMKRMNYGQIAAVFPSAIDFALQEAPEDIVLTDDIEVEENAFLQQNREAPRKGSKQILARKGEMTRYRLEERSEPDPVTGKERTVKKITIAAEGASLPGMISVLYGALQKATEKIDSLESRLNKLEVA